MTRRRMRAQVQPDTPADTRSGSLKKASPHQRTSVTTAGSHGTSSQTGRLSRPSVRERFVGIVREEFALECINEGR